jgi:hypothetical protein
MHAMRQVNFEKKLHINKLEDLNRGVVRLMNALAKKGAMLDADAGGVTALHIACATLPAHVDLPYRIGILEALCKMSGIEHAINSPGAFLKDRTPQCPLATLRSSRRKVDEKEILVLVFAGAEIHPRG